MKSLKFYKDSIGSILNGAKTSTWRLFDDKNLQVGDELKFINKETGDCLFCRSYPKWQLSTRSNCRFG